MEGVEIMVKQQIMSKERKKFLKNNRNKKYLVALTQISILIVFILVWEILAKKGIIDSFLMSQPSRIVQTLMHLGDNELLMHIGVTVYETLIGFLLGTLLGIIIAIILWWSDFLSKVAEPYLVVLNSLPKVALRTNNYNLGRSWNFCNNSNGDSNITSSNNTRKFKWFSKNR